MDDLAPRTKPVLSIYTPGKQDVEISLIYSSAYRDGNDLAEQHAGWSIKRGHASRSVAVPKKSRTVALSSFS